MLNIIDSNLDRLVKTEPNTMVGLIYFNRDVFIVGDCSIPELRIDKKFLDNEKAITT